jgi:hypothetical protein
VIPLTVSANAVTVWESAELVLDAYPGAVLPLYSAVMLWLPTMSEDVVHVAVLPLRETAEQIVVRPSLKVTVPAPLGFPTPEVTVAVYVRELP